MNPVELPPVYAEDLDDDAVRDLLRDIELRGSILEVRLKGGAQARATPARQGWEAARSAFASGQVVGLQVRYAHEGAVWCDTLMRTRDGVRLVRTRPPAAAP